MLLFLVETCGATVELAAHQKRTHYRVAQNYLDTIPHFYQQVLYNIYDKSMAHHP